MITLQYVIQPQDVPAIVRHVCTQNDDLLRAVWQRRQRRFRWLRRGYYLLAILFFLLSLIGLYGAHHKGSLTAASPEVFALSLFFYCLLVALPLLVPLTTAVVVRLVTDRWSEEKRFAAFTVQWQNRIAATLRKSMSGDATCHCTLYADDKVLRCFVRGIEKKRELLWRDYLHSSEDERWLVFYFRVRRKVLFFIVPKRSPLMGKEVYPARLAQLRTLRPE